MKGLPILHSDSSVKAAAIKHFDMQRASGRHYSTGSNWDGPVVPGGDGVGLLEDSFSGWVFKYEKSEKLRNYWH